MLAWISRHAPMVLVLQVTLAAYCTEKLYNCVDRKHLLPLLMCTVTAAICLVPHAQCTEVQTVLSTSSTTAC